MGKKMQAVVVKPKSPMTINYPGSDTLFGAIAWAIRLLEGEEKLKVILDRFSAKNPPFLVSSAFPCNKLDGEFQYLIPMPICPPPRTADSLLITKWKKVLKNVIWADLSFLKEFLQGKFSIMDVLKGLEERRKGSVRERAKSCKTKVKKHWVFDRFEIQNECLASWPVSLSREIEITGNAVNRLTNSTGKKLHFYSAYHFGPDDYFYFLIDCKSEVQKTLLAALRLLEDRGIGGNISSGKGHIKIEIQPFEDPGVPNGKVFVNLSTYCPTREELEYYARNDQLAYSLAYKHSVIECSLARSASPWKKGVLYFTEGSVFPVIDGKEYYGENPVVYDELFPAQQYGFSFPLKGVFEFET